MFRVGQSPAKRGQDTAVTVNVWLLGSCVQVLVWCAGAAKYLSYSLPHLLEGCKDRDANVRQCSVYGLGILAAQHQEAFCPSVPTALIHILGIVTAQDARCFLYISQP